MLAGVCAAPSRARLIDRLVTVQRPSTADIAGLRERSVLIAFLQLLIAPNNELYLNPKTRMLFGNARASLTQLIASVKQV